MIGVTCGCGSIAYADFVKLVRLLLVVAIAVSARAQQDPATFANNLRVGESINGFPNWAERVMLEWTNRARVDPQLEMKACGTACGDAACYTAKGPLVWSEALNHSARFHADEMAKQQYFAHDSKCNVVSNINALYPAACDASASCACNGAGGTPWSTRISLFGAGPTGEIIVSIAEPNSAFYLWLYEPAPSSCAFGANGHRYLILKSDGEVGFGASGTSVGDFGGPATPYKIPSAAHYPKQAETVTVWANWYDTAAPRAASVVVDGKCTTISLQRGTQQNGAWSANVPGVGSGCHRYYLSFIDSTGATITYPATGSLGIGDSSCDDWNSSRVIASCSSNSPVTPAPVPVSKRRAVRRH